MDTLIALGTLAALAVSAVEAIALGGRHLHLGGSGAFAARLHGVMAPLIVAILVTGRAVEARARARAAQAMHSLLVPAPPDGPGGRRAATTRRASWSPRRASRSGPWSGCGRARRSRSTAPWCRAGRRSTSRCSPASPCRSTAARAAGHRGDPQRRAACWSSGSDAVAAESVLARLQRLVEDAQRDKAPLQRIADRISSVFVPAVLVGAAVTFLVWWLVVGNLGKAVLSGLAVLLVACPCAMGLAAPVAMMVGCGRAAALGIFIRSGDALERLAKVDTVVFDKTGTLTERHAEVTVVAAGRRLTGTRCWRWPPRWRRRATTPSPSPSPAAAARVRRRGHRRAGHCPAWASTGTVEATGSRVGRRPTSIVCPASLAPVSRRVSERGETVVVVERGRPA